jgi:hypothetical protein
MTNPARLAAELSRALTQIALGIDEPDPVRAKVYLFAASATLKNVRAALWSEQAEGPRPLRKLAIVGRHDLVQTSGRPPNREIERQRIGDVSSDDPQPDKGKR